MNDLMTKSFLNYVDLKKQAQMDLRSELDLEQQSQINPASEENLARFFHDVEDIKYKMEEITNLLTDLQALNEETKSAHSAKVVRGLRDRMDSDMVSVLRKAINVKIMLEALDQANIRNRKVSGDYKEGSSVDRTRILVTNGLRTKLKDMMNDFLSLRERIVSDYKDCLRRRYYNANGVEPSEELMERMLSGSVQLDVFNGKLTTATATATAAEDVAEESKERHEAVMNIKKSLTKLHQVFLDMAVLVEKQGEGADDIERNVMKAGSFVSGGTNSLFYANRMKKRCRRWIWLVLGIAVVILLVCIISLFSS
uniref:t-SNARE coiled-coil homology domain-containing protein n=1 Tax=Kalanchoe fedtschenkoi TaxID=63787 RepID=A0A7N0T932_KALFE